MSSNITLSASVRSNLLSLQNTASLLDTTQTRLATGNKVNSALDNPTNYFTASALNSRASDLGNLLDGVSNAIQTIQAANDGITSIQKLVDSAKATANQAQQLSEETTTTSSSGGSAEHIAAVTGGTYAAPTGTDATFKINGTDVTIKTTDSITQAISAINTAMSGASINVTATNDGGKIKLTGGVSVDVAVTGTPSGGLTAESDTYVAKVDPTVTSTTQKNPARAALISQFNDLLDQINQLAGDANYNGNNLLVAGSSLKVLFNESGTSNLTISGKGSDFASLGLAKLDTTTGFDSNDKITGILDNLKGATDNLRANASSFGSSLSIVQMRQDFTKSIINTLQTGASNLTLADSNEEAANLLALQTRQSLSTKALSMASQSDQNVLRLLQ
jgi:flagellin-like hook-associated protein FlgL